MGSRKVNTEGIDEELLIASIGRRRQDGTLYHAQEPPAPAPEEESVPETEYNPQNEMFRLLGTKRSFSQNKTFFFSHPYPALFRLISHF